MRTILFSALLCVVSVVSGCMSVTQSKSEQRIVELPADDGNTSLATAALIGQSLIRDGLAADVQKMFPNLSQQQSGGIFLTWNAGVFSGKKSVFFLTGVRYTGSLPEAKAVADYLESRVQEAVLVKFPSAKFPSPPAK